MTTSKRFQKFLSNISLSKTQLADGRTKYRAVTKVLNRRYYSTPSETNNSLLIGSWGKHTRIAPPRDIDMIYVLPGSVYEQFRMRSGNIQSQILTEVRNVLLNTYQTSRIKGDGPAVVINFSSYKVEVIPAFKSLTGRFWICNTKGGGSYIETDPIAEQEAIKTSSDDNAGVTRDLVRMSKAWQGSFKTKPCKSFVLELLAMDFMRTWSGTRSYVYYDWILRDFLRYCRDRAGNVLYAPGTFDTLYVPERFKTIADTDYKRAVKATDLDAARKYEAAGEEWQKIFGSVYMPKTP